MSVAMALTLSTYNQCNSNMKVAHIRTHMYTLHARTHAHCTHTHTHARTHTHSSLLVGHRVDSACLGRGQGVWSHHSVPWHRAYAHCVSTDRTHSSCNWAYSTCDRRRSCCGSCPTAVAAAYWCKGGCSLDWGQERASHERSCDFVLLSSVGRCRREGTCGE